MSKTTIRVETALRDAITDRAETNSSVRPFWQRALRFSAAQRHVFSPTSLYEAFELAEARRLTEKLEIHYTPKHGSWLDMAETELSTLTRQCLNRRIPDMDTLTSEVAAWETARNESEATVDWQFTTDQARTKLKRLYPSIQN